ncbi:histidine kinase [Paractinoplanes toevensis]|uniref:histidine kinase n=1 Tax=Paractinoplanes toevensis TaxID=571911 RepID=A0A919W3U6_9ACTN|nr:histidine kinase [Actinoplanes toevensis]
MLTSLHRACLGSRQLLSGGPTALLALVAFVLTAAALASSPPLGALLLPVAATANRKVATRERRRVGRLLGTPVEYRYAPLLDAATPAGHGYARRWLTIIVRTLAARSTYQDAAWTAVHGLLGTALIALVPALWAAAIAAVAAVPFWLFVPGTSAAWLLPTALAPVTLLVLRSLPTFAHAQARLSARMLAEPAQARMSARLVELAETRAGALAAHSAELRRIERDLHDGAQARLVSIALRLALAERRMTSDPVLAADLVGQAREGAEAAMGELRDLIRGLYPPILADRGLVTAVEALAARSPVPVTVTVDARTAERPPAAVEAAAYFGVSEALANVAKHSGAGQATLGLVLDDDRLVIVVTDDGTGGADESRGTGLSGIRHRVAAFDGSLALSSPAGGPTVLTIRLPCTAEADPL